MADASGEWTDRSYLRTVQYRDPANLAARQSIYAFQEPAIDLPAWVLDRAGLTGTETVADIGCGNGAYLAELGRRVHAGTVMGLDLSEGMARAARDRLTTGATAVADATLLPIRTSAVHVTLAMHMLYHVPDRSLAVAEFRRIQAVGGVVLVVLNGYDHLRQLRVLIEEMLTALSDPPGSVSRLDLDVGESLLRPGFSRVERHEVHAQLVVPTPEPILDYVASMNIVRSGRVEEERAMDFARDAVEKEIGRSGAFRINTHSGCLVCR